MERRWTDREGGQRGGHLQEGVVEVRDIGNGRRKEGSVKEIKKKRRKLWMCVRHGASSTYVYMATL